MTIAMPHAVHEPAPRVTVSGRLRQADVDSSERNYAVWIHISPLVGFMVVGPLAVFAPLIMWLARREVSAFNDDHGREVANVLITAVIVTVIGAMVPILGWLAAAVWYVVLVINLIRGAVAASNGEYFRYPMTMRLLS